LLHGDEGHIALSPYTIVFGQVPAIGYYAASLMNAVILTAVLSCGNSSMYVASRMLHAMAHSSKAPKSCGRLNRRGVPAVALMITALVSALTFFSSMIGDQKIYQLLYNASSLSGFLIWFGIAVCHIRFRRAWLAQGRRIEDLKFSAKFYPYGTWLALIMFVVVILGANYSIFQAQPFSWFDFVTSYVMLPVYIALYLIHKYHYKTRLVSLRDCDFGADCPLEA
jgi:lysine-specific permease